MRQCPSLSIEWLAVSVLAADKQNVDMNFAISFLGERQSGMVSPDLEGSVNDFVDLPLGEVWEILRDFVGEVFVSPFASLKKIAL